MEWQKVNLVTNECYIEICSQFYGGHLPYIQFVSFDMSFMLLVNLNDQ